MRPQPGDLINGKYRLIRLIGDGGMGSVFEARHEYLGTVVALKFLHSELASRSGLVARFLREARLSASIQSDHIARVTDVDQASDGAAYLVMELLQGESLRTLIEREGRISPQVALDYTMQILDGLEAAHAIGVVHRDLKPDNVFVVTTKKGPLIKLLDFGIAKLRSSKEFQGALTRPGVMMGTPEYMAPEQAYAADSVDVRADVYSVGAMLYEMLAGQRPAQGDDPLEIAAFIMAQKVPRLSQVDRTIPERLSEVVHRAMAPMPADRFTTAGELRNALTPLTGSIPPAVRAPQGRGVPATLPPDAGDPARPATRVGATYAGSGGTVRADVDGRLAHAATPNYTPPAYALRPPPDPNEHVPGIPPPAAYANLPAVPGHTNRGPRRLSVWLLIGMSVLAIGIVAVALASGQFDLPSTSEPARTAAPTATTPAARPTAAPTPASPTVLPPIGTPVQPTPTAPGPATTPTKAPAKPRTDAGTAPATDDAAAPAPTIPGLPGIPFPIPSTLPIPQIPIPIPSTFPPFNIPGFPGAPTPAPTSSQ
ncbi:MAG: protein kinase [Polyangiaceae bacterium]